MHLVASVCLSIRPFVCALMLEPFDLRPSPFAWRSTLKCKNSLESGKKNLAGLIIAWMWSIGILINDNIVANRNLILLGKILF